MIWRERRRVAGDPATRPVAVGSAARRAVDVKREVLVVDLLVGAVGADLLQRLVELVAERGVLLPHGDAGAIAENRAGIEEGGADELEILAGVCLEEAQL